MENIGERLIWHYWPGTDILIPLGGLNPLTILGTLIAMFIAGTLLWLGSRRLAALPGRGQCLVELFIGAFDGLVSAALELEPASKNRKFVPLIFSLFMFIWASNMMNIIPLPFIEEPTTDLNTTLSLGIMGVSFSMICGVRFKGLKGFMEELLGPMWHTHGGSFWSNLAGKASSVFFFPLNVVGEGSKIISVSFRLFGNITGAAIIFVVVSSLVHHMVLPLPMHGFFTFFEGAIQAFVFTMLTLTYIAVAIK